MGRGGGWNPLHTLSMEANRFVFSSAGEPAAGRASPGLRVQSPFLRRAAPTQPRRTAAAASVLRLRLRLRRNSQLSLRVSCTCRATRTRERVCAPVLSALWFARHERAEILFSTRRGDQVHEEIYKKGQIVREKTELTGANAFNRTSASHAFARCDGAANA